MEEIMSARPFYQVKIDDSFCERGLIKYRL
ncbi:hypothetical protein Belba_2411 [Belliella baltica DSM 15883]|uniref:Uncharacterized protein n=1 Tax=Belliella baltica (strain DSM 15883 / CIP 108006 / LMG 21964 / BA134) TaxID=866536 RepID=I3Z6V2_BELBD|nr:hypothetical protein Belba_2411 [Belliella baltica DSM 15883]